MRDQDIDFACLAEESDELRPMSIRYGVTADEAGQHEPLDLTLSQEEPDQANLEDGAWDDVDPGVPAVTRTHANGLPEDLDEEPVAVAAEQAAMH
jgi:hypothetical protein